MIELPVLGLGDEQSSPTTVTWRDGTGVCRGILGTLDAEWLKDYQDRQKAEADYKRKLEELRDRDVVVLDDYRRNLSE